MKFEIKDHIRWILIVDDDPEIRELVKAKIHNNFKSDVKIVEACDGIEATNKLAFQAFDCIITDLQMPRRQGGAFIKVVKGSQLNSKTPIVILTGHPEPELLKEHEAINMIEKPFKEAEFIQIISNLLHIGKTDERLSSNIINLMLESCLVILKDVCKLSAVQEKAMAKIAGQDLLGDIQTVLLIRNTSSQSTLILSAETLALTPIRKALFPSEEQASAENVLRKLSNGVFVHLSKNFVAQKTGAVGPQLLQMLYIEGKTSSNYQQLVSEKGITIPISTDGGKIYLTALAGK